MSSHTPTLTYWHGGPTVYGTVLLPPSDTGSSRSGPSADAFVYVTPTRDLAATYAATCRGWVYEVKPVGPVTQDPGSVLPLGESLRCASAVIVRRFRVSRAECDLRQAVVDSLSRQMDGLGDVR